MAKLTEGADKLWDALEALQTVVGRVPKDDSLATAVYYRDEVLPAMAALRTEADALELLCAKEYWPLPTYGDLLFGVN